MLISSKENAMAKQAKRLLSDASERRKTATFLIEGARLCEDAALTGIHIKTAFFTQAGETKYPEQVSAIKQSAEEVFEITDTVSAAISDTKNPQGVFCICSRKQNSDCSELDLRKKYLALEDIQDPGNLGTIIRTAEALGIDALLISDKSCDPDNPKVIRASMGGSFRLPIFMFSNFSNMVLTWNEQGFKTFACVPDSHAEKITEVSFESGSICFIGNEANGLKEETIQNCMKSITIPMKGNAESLNAAIAACLTMWQMVL